MIQESGCLFLDSMCLAHLHMFLALFLDVGLVIGLSISLTNPHVRLSFWDGCSKRSCTMYAKWCQNYTLPYLF